MPFLTSDPAWFTSVVQANHKTSATSWTGAISGDACGGTGDGSLLVAVVAADNYQTGSGTTINCSNVEMSNNPGGWEGFTKAAGWNNAAAAAAAAEVSIWYCRPGYAISTAGGNNFRVSFTNAVVAKALTIYRFRAWGSEYFAVGPATGAEADGAAPANVNPSGYDTSITYLHIYGVAMEMSWTSGDTVSEANCSSWVTSGTATSGSASNMCVGAMHRIYQPGSSNDDPIGQPAWTGSKTADNAAVQAALYLARDTSTEGWQSGTYGGNIGLGAGIGVT